jgi:iron complex outermembrane receptor protein
MSSPGGIMNIILKYTKQAILAALFVFPAVAMAAPDDDLANIPLESLMELKVTSVSKKSQPMTNAAAAVFVITQEDIRRSGVTSIPEALRMAPGIQVARIDSNKWAISSRGFNGRFANKLLVLMDGRSLYTPFFVGVYWEVQDTILDDIERIEIIRGPGAALWGANAVNGVINIVTKSAENTKGTLISAGAGSSEKALLAARTNAALGDNSNVRIYAKHQEHGSFEGSSGPAHDSWYTSQGGFRLDSQPTARDTFTVHGDYYDGKLDETYHLYNLTPPTYQQIQDSSTVVKGGNILGRWHRTLSDNNNLSLQMYYDHTEHGMLVSPQKFNTFDLDFQHRFSPGASNDIVWGVGYRLNEYTVINTPTLSFDQNDVTDNLYSSFIHDEITLIPEKLFLIIGSRFEYSTVAKLNVQPNTRILWAVTPHTSVWGSVSRAVRSRTKGEQDIRYNYRTIPPLTDPNTAPVPLRLEIVGNPGFKSEELLAYEAGYRTELSPRLTADIAVYYNSYKNLRVISPGSPYQVPSTGTPTHVVQPYYLSNDMHGHALGAELSVEWTPFFWWRLQTAYSYEQLTMFLDGTSQDYINKGNAESDTPKHQLSLRSGFDIGKQVTLDLWLRGTGRLASIDGNAIPGYVTMDARLAWKPVKNLELSLAGQNLFQHQHDEFIPEYINTLPSSVIRSVYGKVTMKF